ncbi:RlpA-like double-psi beta-barrel-protein domain-containing protein-containing protein [Mycena polygramma]|nr:RlpA-like double-psi beta-barrel-protein domain-containing protein-containing protein [Mycena polygramma]
MFTFLRPRPRVITYSRVATYYDPDGGLGACGWAIQNSDLAVAIGAGHWDNGAHCGHTMTVTCELAAFFSSPNNINICSVNGATVQATVADLCPGCQGDNGIDLTPGAIGAIDPNYVNNGVDSVTWSVV